MRQMNCEEIQATQGGYPIAAKDMLFGDPYYGDPWSDSPNGSFAEGAGISGFGQGNAVNLNSVTISTPTVAASLIVGGAAVAGVGRLIGSFPHPVVKAVGGAITIAGIGVGALGGLYTVYSRTPIPEP